MYFWRYCVFFVLFLGCADFRFLPKKVVVGNPLVEGWKVLHKNGADQATKTNIKSLYKNWLESAGMPSEHLARINKFDSEALDVYQVLGKEIKENKITIEQLKNKEFAEKWFEKRELDYLWGLKNEMTMLLGKKRRHWRRMKEELGIDLSYDIVKINKPTRGNHNCVYCSLTFDYFIKGGKLIPVKFNPRRGPKSTFTQDWFGRNMKPQ